MVPRKIFGSARAHIGTATAATPISLPSRCATDWGGHRASIERSQAAGVSIAALGRPYSAPGVQGYRKRRARPRQRTGGHASCRSARQGTSRKGHYMDTDFRFIRYFNRLWISSYSHKGRRKCSRPHQHNRYARCAFAPNAFLRTCGPSFVRQSSSAPLISP